MSQSAQSRPTGQILQYTAVVFAGMASIGLTVAAGTYVVNQIGGSHSVMSSGGRHQAAVPEFDPGRPETRVPVVTAGNWESAAGYRELPASFTAPAVPADRGEAHPPAPVRTPISTPAPQSAESPTGTADPAGLGGRLAVSEDTYVDANVSRTQQHSITLTVGTNLPGTWGNSADTGTGTEESPGDRTTGFRTDIDVHTGEISVSVSDPPTGRHEMRIERNTLPAPVPAEQPQQIGQDGSPPA